MRHFQKGGPLDNCKKGGARGDRLIRLTQYPPLIVSDENYLPIGYRLI